MENRIRKTIQSIKSHWKFSTPGHDLAHFMSVYNNAKRALEGIRLQDDNQRELIYLACLCHDLDDRKLVPEGTPKWFYTKKILNIAGISEDNIVKVIELISLVSCSAQNKGIEDDEVEKWKLIPRDCDRLEALGNIGIKRCKEYTEHSGMPYHTEDTPRCKSHEELYRIATAERYKEYKGNSRSMIDHYYDKLLHIHKLDSGNEYLQRMANIRHDKMVNYVLNYWNNNV